MTIIAGFHSVDGVIICGDTQETVNNLSKKHVTKVKVTPEFPAIRELYSGSDLATSFCGAGDGPFIDMITRKAWAACEHATDLDDACERIEAKILETYQSYGNIYQVGQCPTVDLIYGVKMAGGSRLFSASGPVVNPVEDYCSAGIGYYMADFLASRMYNGGLSLHQCVILAAYVLFQAKEHVDGCGGDSHIAVLRNNGKSGLMDQSRIRAITQMLNQTDRKLGEVLLAAANLQEDYETIMEMTLETTKDTIEYARNAAKESIESDDLFSDMWMTGKPDRDDLGFATPSIPQTLEDQQ